MQSFSKGFYKALVLRNFMFGLNLVGLCVYHQPCACLGNEYFIMGLSKLEGGSVWESLQDSHKHE